VLEVHRTVSRWPRNSGSGPRADIAPLAYPNGRPSNLPNSRSRYSRVSPTELPAVYLMRLNRSDGLACGNPLMPEGVGLS